MHDCEHSRKRWQRAFFARCTLGPAKLLSDEDAPDTVVR